MTQETKLGLVIGGAFILCFALILSNTQDRGAVEEQIASLLSAGKSQPDSAELAGAGKAPHEIVEYTPRPPRPTLHEEKAPPPQIGSPPTDAASRIGAGTSDQHNSPPDRKVIAQAGSGLATELRQSPPPTRLPPPPPVTDVIANPPLQQPSGAAGASGVDGQDLRTTSSPKSAPRTVVPAEAAPPATTTPSDPQPRRVQSYVVAKEDTLSKIARKFYGQATHENIEEIFRSNRTALPTRDALRIGQSLEIPLKEQPRNLGTAPRQNPGVAETVNALTQLKPAEVHSKPVGEPNKNADDKWEWYQVKPKDRYASIAQERLGDQKRWTEIFELNKTTFPDPDAIRPGVRIRIPRGR